MTEQLIPDYGYSGAAHSHAHDYLLPLVDRLLADLQPERVFDLGCGNGSVAAHLSKKYDVTGVDASRSGIEQARLAFPGIRFDVASAYDDLTQIYGQFDAVVSLEVVEHLYDPRLYARNMFNLVRPGGGIVISTPYHGYLKNLALALTGKMESHFTALWDGGHIKFFSVNTLSQLLTEAGFVDLKFERAGRIRQLAKSMICLGRRPSA
jgi:2-polyprenyl-3-methyl-5-hydroxy-6-metoxy-1,4-benzoquinol methylase